MDYSLYQSWLSHEDRNGFSHGVSDALNGNPAKGNLEHVNFMPLIQDKMASESWEKLAQTRADAYKLGYDSVTRFTVTSFSKKEAEQTAASLKRNGYAVIRTDKESKYIFVITAATSKRISVHEPLPYGAKKA